MGCGHSKRAVHPMVISEQKTKTNPKAQPEANLESIISNTPQICEYIKFETIIEIDMHGLDPNITNPYEWVSRVKQTLASALSNKVDYVNFIPGRGNHTDYYKKPFLRPIVMMTIRMCGFDCYPNDENDGYIICPISSYKKLPENIEGENFTLTENDEIIIELLDVDPEIFINMEANEGMQMIKTYKTVKEEFKTMPYICHIILAARDPVEQYAMKTGKKFMQFFESPVTESTQMQEMEEQRVAHEMKVVDNFVDNYYYDRSFIEHVARDKSYNEKRITKILDRVDEIPDRYFQEFMEFAEDHPTLSVQSLLDLSIESKYDKSTAEQMLLSTSMKEYDEVSNILNVYKTVKTLRNKTFAHKRLYGDLNMPKIFPTIEVNLCHAGLKKAVRSVDRIINLLASQDFGEIALFFADETENNDFHPCSSDEISEFITQKAQNDQINIFKNPNPFAKGLRFFISNIANDENGVN